MNEKHVSLTLSGMTPTDVLYIAFRHKWKIGLISAAGIICALALPWFVPRMYQSEAKLFVKYVVDTKSPGQVGMTGSRVISDEGANAINTEVEILTSLDLAQQVADTIGPERILAKAGGGTNRYAAGALIQKNLIPEALAGSKVIRVIFKHPDREIVQTVLDQFIQAYLKKHEEIHQHVGVFDDFLTQQTDQLRSRLLATEDELKRAKTNAGIISLEDSKRAYTEQISKIQEDIRGAEAELAERQAIAEEMAKMVHAAPLNSTNTNVVAVAPEKISEYKRICAVLDGLRKRQQDLLVQFTPENSWVKQVEDQIDAKDKIKQQLEEANPGLVALSPADSKESSAADGMAALRTSYFTEAAKATALQSKIRVLISQLAGIRKEAGSIEDVEGPLTDLQRRRNLQEKNYEYFAANLEQSKIDQALGAGRAYNISVIQLPSPPTGADSKLSKLMAMVLLGSIAAALGLAYLIEFHLDKTIKRPLEIEGRLGSPLLLSIPFFGSNAKSRLFSAKKKARALTEHASKTDAADGKTETAADAAQAGEAANGSEIAPWDPRYILRPFCDALRDGLITFFEVNNLTHKPKLVAVTSCSEKAGVSTLAAGLAASLSETGDGNVLLVDMNQKDGSIRDFCKGEVARLDDALENETRGQAMVQNNLYMAAETTNGDSLSVVLPKRFKNLVPRLRASDYDYIIFDMPVINQITATQRLARFMDMVLLVVESDKTDGDVAKRATSLLRESKTNVGVVLNKTRTYIPRQLHREL